MTDEERGALRATNIKVSIGDIHDLLGGLGLEDVRDNRTIIRAFERLLEVISEASRHIPDTWKHEYGSDIDWRGIADIGNALRHAYWRIDLDLLWSIYANRLDDLERAVDAMVAAHPLKD